MIIPVFRRKEGASRVDEPLIADDSFHTVSFPRGRLVVPEFANLCKRGGEKKGMAIRRRRRRLESCGTLIK